MKKYKLFLEVPSPNKIFVHLSSLTNIKTGLWFRLDDERNEFEVSPQK